MVSVYGFSYPDDRIFTRQRLVEILEGVVGKTLGDVDTSNVFQSVIESPGKKGIAGDVVEQSILEYKKDNKQDPDILVDMQPTEVKTTGLENKKNSSLLVAKENVSITAVSLDKIDKETFEDSNYWHKLSHLLFVFYHYDKGNKGIIKAIDYKDFIIKAYKFHEFNEHDKKMLMEDWLLIHEFAKEHSANIVNDWKRLSHDLKKDLVLVDTAPKYPPRFRLKKDFVTSIAQECLNVETEQLATPITKYKQIDEKCHEFNEKYRDKSVLQLCEELSIHNDSDIKNISEILVLRMFGIQKGKLNDIKDFQKVSLIAKSLPLNADGSEKEDTKLGLIDFSEWMSSVDGFHDSDIYRYFSEHYFLFAIFQLSGDKRDGSEVFKGFKRYRFSDLFINKYVKYTWTEVRKLIRNHKLRIVESGRGSAPNFPKQGRSPKDWNKWPKNYHPFFVRGGANKSDDKHKTLEINGHRMIPQFAWIDGSYMVHELSQIDFL